MTLSDALKEFSPTTELDRNIEPYGEEHFEAEIPLFDLPIAAGGWESVWDNQDAGHHICDKQLRQGVFRVRVRGDSMSPRYPDGCVVEFKCMMSEQGTPDFDGLEVGKRYYVQLDDGSGTFKELAAIEPDHLLLRALNRKYKTPLRADISRIQKLARAVGRFDPD